MHISQLRSALHDIGARHPISTRRPTHTTATQTVRTTFGDAEPPRAHVVFDGPHIEEDRSLNDYHDFPWLRRIAREEEEMGLDALAWYVSFHNTQEEWGIYIPMTSLAYIAERWLATLRRPFTEKMALAYEALAHHESIHYAVDRNVAGWEMILGLPLHGNVPQTKRYNGYILAEEALANAQKLRQIRRRHNTSCVRAIERWVLQSPPGYRDGPLYVEDRSFVACQGEVAKVYAGDAHLQKTPNLPSPEFIKWHGQFAVNQHVDLTGCPIHLIDDQPFMGWGRLDVRLH